MTVPGVNVICAATFMAAIGEIGRFENPRKLVGYLGLDPRVSQSGSGPATHGRISKQGSGAVRHALVEAAWSVGSPAGPDPRLLRAGARTARPPGRDRRRGAQARLPVLVPAHPRGGLRLRTAVADREEAAPARDPRRRAEPQGRPHRDLRDPPADARRPSASSPSRPRPPIGAASATGRPPRRRERAPARHRGAHLVGRQATKQRGRTKPQRLRFSSSSPAPTETLRKEEVDQSSEGLTFMRRPRRSSATAAHSLPLSDPLQALGGRRCCQSSVMTTLPLARPCST